MPIYEYGCLECGEQFEKFVRQNNSDPIVCPACGSTQIDRMLSLFSASQGAPHTKGEDASPVKPGTQLHRPHCGIDWAKP